MDKVLTRRLPSWVTLLDKTTIQWIQSMPVSRSHLVEFSMNDRATNEKERAKLVSAYFNQPEVDEVAKMKSVRLTPYVILFSGTSNDGTHTLKSAQYLQKEMPIRIARRIIDFRSLPFIVGCNPSILSVHELYLRAFKILNSFSPIKSPDEEAAYSKALKQLLDDHSEVVADLTIGFRQSQKHITDHAVVAAFLDRTITSRLSIRMLAQHHLGLREKKQNYVGIINQQMNLKEVIDRSSRFVGQMALHKFGRIPEIRISGHVDATFPYIEMPLDYMLPELLKNAVRATVQDHSNEKKLPPIYITIASNPIDFVIRISDRGGGIPHKLYPYIMQYNFTTAKNEEYDQVNTDIFSNMVETCNKGAGEMYGFGVGLPTSKAYAMHMGGDLTVQTMQGIGTDVYLRMKHLHSKDESIRI